MKIDSGRKRALDASSRNSESPEKRRMSRTGDDAPFRKSFGGSENEQSIRIEQNEEPIHFSKP